MIAALQDSLPVHRAHFAITAIFHYIFPQLTMGLALVILVLKSMALRGDGRAEAAARFWIRIFGVAFVMGVVTGIPLEFQFGTNWSRFAAATGGVIGQTLAMEGVFAFFLESTFVGLLLYGEKRLGPRWHWAAALLLWMGTWLSGYFIVATNAWMQHPVGIELLPGGELRLRSIAALLTNPWAVIQYSHTMIGSVITGSFTVAGIGAWYLLRGEHVAVARRFLAVAVVLGAAASLLAIFPTGDSQVRLVHDHQPPAFAAMEGAFLSEYGAGLVILGQPNLDEMRIDNPIVLPRLLSFLTHARWDAEVRGLDAFDRSTWPDNVELLYYCYHVMAGLGTMFLLIMAASAIALWRGQLHETRWLLWVLMLAWPFAFVANTAGWATAELGRQPWIVYGIMRTADSHSAQVSSGNAMFTLIGFVGLYALLGVLFLFITGRLIAKGPDLPASG